MFPGMANMNSSYPPQGGPPGGMGGPGGMPPRGGPMAPPGAPAGGSGGNPNYFTDKKKGEVNELKNVRVSYAGPLWLWGHED